MDRLIYTAMTGAKGTMDQQAAVAHNLANVNSTGFRAELHRLRAVDVQTEARIIELLLVTTVPVMFLAERGVPSVWLVVATLIGGTLSAGAQLSPPLVPRLRSGSLPSNSRGITEAMEWASNSSA